MKKHKIEVFGAGLAMPEKGMKFDRFPIGIESIVYKISHNDEYPRVGKLENISQIQKFAELVYDLGYKNRK